MKIASFNVNSLRARLDPLLDWMDAHQPDVLCLQETKLPDREFPVDAFGDLGYDVVFHGQTAYNGVAIAAKDEMRDVQRGLRGFDELEQKRIISCLIGDLRVASVYVPNGTALGTDKFSFKLAWLDALREHLRPMVGAPLVVCGDMNIAPADIDVYDPRAFAGETHVTPEERARFRALLDLGLHDAFRVKYPERQLFTWWDYRSGSFQRDAGLRIDHFLVTGDLAPKIVDITVDLTLRENEVPSDHATVILEIDA